MTYIDIPKDLSLVKNKIVAGLTARQLVCFSLGGLVGAPIFLLTRKVIGQDAAMWLMLIATAPFFFLGVYEKDGLPLEKCMKYYLRSKYYPRIRVFRHKNIYQYLAGEEALSPYVCPNQAKILLKNGAGDAAKPSGPPKQNAKPAAPSSPEKRSGRPKNARAPGRPSAPDG